MSTALCTIEQHAIMFALISKHAIELCGEKGKEAILLAMTVYGNERGKRMAARALARGDALNVITSQAYGEWVPDYAGQMVFGRISGEPTLRTFISKCAWCEAWEKHNLLEYGKLYCVDVDNAVFQGFNAEFLCTPLTKSMSFGGERCEFDWGQAFTQEDSRALEAKRAELGKSCVKDFNYHTAHLYVSLGQSLAQELGTASQQIMEKALEEFVHIFGKAYADAFEPHKEKFSNT